MAALDTFHTETLPAMLSQGREALLAGQNLPAMGLVVEGQGAGYTYTLADGALAIAPGTDKAEFSVTLSAQDWEGLVADVETTAGILYGNRLLEYRGDRMQFMRWEPVLRALYTGRPIYRPGTVKLRNPAGHTLDPGSMFDLSDNDDSMRDFLDAAGYLLVKSVFSEEEIFGLRQAAMQLAKQAREGDQQSWWGKSETGEARLCRCLNAGTLSAFSGLYEDARIARLAGLLPEGVDHPEPSETDGITVVYKNPGVSEGLSDLPWHRDCGMGGHALMCPTYVFSIYLFDATPQQGCLQFLPGSHRYAYGFADTESGPVPGAETVPARAGDVTVHTGDVMHAAPPPEASTGQFRQSILLSYYSRYKHHRGERHYNDVLLGAEDGQVAHLRSLVEE